MYDRNRAAQIQEWTGGKPMCILAVLLPPTLELAFAFFGRLMTLSAQETVEITNLSKSRFFGFENQIFALLTKKLSFPNGRTS